MGLFGKKNKRRPYQKRTVTPEQQQEKLEKKKAWESLVKQMKENPELEKEFVFKKMGIELKEKDPTEKKRQELKSTLMDEAVKLIGEDEDLRREYAESMIGEVIGRSKARQGRHGDMYSEMGSDSPIMQALEEMESLSEFKTKLAELGMGNDSQGGFFKGLTMKGILDTIQMLKGEGGQASESVYIVQVDGTPTKVTENQYNHLVKEGRIRPIAELAPPKGEPKKEQPEEDEGIQPIVSEETTPPNLPSLDNILERIDLGTMKECLDGNPEDFVELLRQGVQEEDEGSKFLWGFLANTTYEGVMDLIKLYREDERITDLVDRLASDEGKEWLEAVISKIQEEQNV